MLIKQSSLSLCVCVCVCVWLGVYTSAVGYYKETFVLIKWLGTTSVKPQSLNWKQLTLEL